MPADLAKVEAEAELRAGIIDRLIIASLREGSAAREASLERWRRLGTSPVLSAKTRGNG